MTKRLIIYYGVFSLPDKCFPVYLPGCPWPFHSICAFWCFLLLQPPSTCQKCHPGLCLCIQPWSGQTLPAVSPRQPKRRPSLVGKTGSRCAHCGQYFLQFCSFLPRIRVWNTKAIISHRIYSMSKVCRNESLNLFHKIECQHYQFEIHMDCLHERVFTVSPPGLCVEVVYRSTASVWCLQWC